MTPSLILGVIYATTFLGIETSIWLALIGSGGLVQFLNYRANQRTAQVNSDSVVINSANEYVSMVASEMQNLRIEIDVLRKRVDELYDERNHFHEGSIILTAQIVKLGEEPDWP